MNPIIDPLYIFCNQDFVKANLNFVKAVGLVAACLLTEIISKRHYHIMRDEIINDPKHGDGWIYYTLDDVEEKLCLTRDEQDAAIKKLKDKGLLETKVIGLPGKRHFRLNDDKILELYGLSKKHSSLRKFHKLDCGISTTSIEEIPQTRPYSIIQDKTKDKTKDKCAPPDGDAFGANCKLSFNPSSQKNQSALSSTKTPLTSPYPNVVVTVEEHEKLVDTYGIELVKEAYFDLSEWKDSADPKIVAKHKSDYRRLRKWVIPQLQEDKMKQNRLKEQNIAPHRRGSKLVTPGDYDKDDYRAPRI